jgi:hypothetical protein
MAQYLLLIYGDETGLAAASEADRNAMFKRYGEYTAWLSEKGWLLAGDALHDTSQATNVRVKDGERIVTDGPFAETKEQLGGFYQIEVDNLDDAIEAAARCPGSMFGTIEVRPIMAT